MANKQREIKTIFSLDGETKYTDSVKRIKKEKTLLRAETNALSTAFDTSNDKQKKLTVQADSLSKQIELQKRIIAEAQNAVEQSNKKYGEGSEKTMEYKIQLANAEAELGKLQTQLAKTNKEILTNESRLKKAGDAAATAGEKMKQVGDGISNFGDKMTEKVTKPIIAGAATAGAAVLALGVTTVKNATDMTESLNGFISATGKSVDETERYKKVLTDIYAANFGEDYKDIADAMALVNQQMGDMPDDKLESTTKNAILLRDTFDIDINEGIRGANALMKQFGVDAETAYNLMVQGAQKGLNQNQDLADQISEYAVYYADLGYSVEDMFAAMENGAKNGAFQIDYLNDIMKEFGIRSKDNSTASAEAFKTLNLNAEEMTKAFAAGGDTARAAFEQVTEKLFSMDDAVKQNEAGVALFGTKWEDLGIDAVKALTNTNGTIDKTKDKLGELNKIKYNDLGSMLKGIGRQIEVELLPAAEEIIPIIQDVVTDILPDIKKALPEVVGLVKDAVPVTREVAGAVLDVVRSFAELDPKTQEMIVKAGLAIAAVGPVAKTLGAVTSAAGTATKAVGTFTSKLAEKAAAAKAAELAAGGLSASMSGGAGLLATLGPVGLALGAVALAAGGVALVYHEMTRTTREAGEAGAAFAEGMADWRSGIDQAKSALEGFNMEAVVSSAKMSELEKNISDTQQNIIGIAERAAEESRAYTEAETLEIQKLVGLLKDYTDQKIEAYQKQAEVVAAMATQERDVTLTRAQELIKGAEDARQQTLTIAEGRYMDQVGQAEALYGKLGEKDKAHYDEMVKNALQEKDLYIQSANDTHGETLAIIQQKYREYNTEDMKHLEAIKDANARKKQAEQDHADAIAEIETYMANSTEDYRIKNGTQKKLIREADAELAKATKQFEIDIKQAYEGANDASLQSMVGMVINTELYGGKVDQKSRELVDALIKSYEELPEEGKQAMHDTMQGMLNGMAEKEPSLFEKAGGVANGIIKKLKTAFDIRSPSRVTRAIGRNTIDSMGMGMSDAQGILLKTAEIITGALIKKQDELKKQVIEAQNKRIKEQEQAAADTWKRQIDAKYAELEKAEKKNKQKIQDEILKLQAEHDAQLKTAQEKATEESLKNQIAALEELQREYQSARDEIIAEQDRMAEKLAEYGALFTRTQTEFGEIFELRDLTEDIRQIEAYGTALQTLKAKGAPDDLMAEIQGMSIEDGLAYAQSLIDLNDQEYDAYIEKWVEKQEAARKVAEEFYKGELTALDEEFVDKIPEQFEGVQDSLYTIGSEAGAAAADGLRSQLQNVMAAAQELAAAMQMRDAYAADLASISGGIATVHAAQQKSEAATKKTTGAASGGAMQTAGKAGTGVYIDNRMTINAPQSPNAAEVAANQRDQSASMLLQLNAAKGR